MAQPTLWESNKTLWNIVPFVDDLPVKLLSISYMLINDGCSMAMLDYQRQDPKREHHGSGCSLLSWLHTWNFIRPRVQLRLLQKSAKIHHTWMEVIWGYCKNLQNARRSRGRGGGQTLLPAKRRGEQMSHTSFSGRRAAGWSVRIGLTRCIPVTESESGWWFHPSWKILVSWEALSHMLLKNTRCLKPPTRNIHI